jgi:hypothetical protein
LGSYPRYISRHPLAILAVAAVLAGVGGFTAWHLRLRTSFAELLPSDDPGVVALAKMQKRIGDMSLLLIGIRSPDPAANERYAELITGKLRELPPNVCALATYNVRDIRSFFEKNKWLYASEENLESIRDRLRLEITRRKNPLLVDLGDDESIEEMRTRLTKHDSLSDKFPGGLFTDKDGQYLWIAALPPGGLFVERAGEGLWQAAQELIAQNPPEHFHPAMRAQVSGPIVTALANRRAVERDILWVTITCMSIVALSIGLYFRRLRAVFLVGLPGIVGTVFAFAVAELAFGYLNSSTAFLGSIILGNGINYGIVLMSRYEEHRAKGETTEIAIFAAIQGVWRATGSAAIAASAAYASLMVTSFRGFYQFGVMGAAGAIACWAATFTVLPAMLVVLDRRAGAYTPSRAPISLEPLGHFLGRHSRPVLLVSLALTAVGIFGVTHFLKDPFEYDFRKLNARIATTEEAKQFNRSLDDLFGRWPSPTIILADKQEEVEPIRQAIRHQDVVHNGNDPLIGQIVTIYDLLPGVPEAQARKLRLLDSIRRLVHDPALSVLNEKERRDLDQIDPPANLRELTPTDLPALARRPFTEIDGTVGRVVLVYPPEKGFSIWDGRILLRIAAVLQQIHLPDKTIDTAGSAVVFGSMIRSVLRDGPIATGASLLAVLLLVSLTLRPVVSGAFTALATLLAGVIWMVGAAGLAEVRVTFLNFIALPITFGIGAEYALNVVARCQQERDVVRSVISTGGAVALCSWTTIVGYGSLLAASNRALRGFGMMAILGEIACLSAAIVALPAFLIWRQRRAGGSKTG